MGEPWGGRGTGGIAPEGIKLNEEAAQLEEVDRSGFWA